MKTFHILNGDSLKEQFPKTILGQLIVARECLIDGNVQGRNLNELFANRAEHIEGYAQVPKGEYQQKTVPEITKITQIPQGSKVYCWFEEDLFCQVNFWFVLSLLIEKLSAENIYLVRPSKGNEYSFGHMNSEDLVKAFHQATLISAEELAELSTLWRFYQDEKYSEMLEIASKHSRKFSFLTPAILAQIDRLPDASGFGRPERTLLAIMSELQTQDFSTVYQCFYKRTAIYSFGDLQVKRMFDQLLKQQHQS